MAHRLPICKPLASIVRGAPPFLDPACHPFFQFVPQNLSAVSVFEQVIGENIHPDTGLKMGPVQINPPWYHLVFLYPWGLRKRSHRDVILSRRIPFRGAWVAQSVKHPTSAQVMISRSVGSSPALGSVLTAQSLEPVSDSVSPSLCDPPPFMLCLSLSQK